MRGSDDPRLRVSSPTPTQTSIMNVCGPRSPVACSTHRACTPLQVATPDVPSLGKRLRTDSIVQDTPGEIRLKIAKDYWYSDGNVIFLADDGTARKVHISAAVQSSTFFETLFDPKFPLTVDEAYDGCPIVRMPGEKPSDVGTMVSMMYGGPKYVILSIS